MDDFPERYSSLLLENCKITDGNKKAIEAGKRWCSERINLFFYGSPGTGKTHIASAIMNASPWGNHQFISVPRMFLEFQAGVKEHEEISLIRKFSGREKYSSPPTCILYDDVGAHRTSDFCLEMFGILLDGLYSNNATGFIFTSNLSPKKIAETMGERIASRLQGLAEPIKLEGGDMRLGLG